MKQITYSRLNLQKMIRGAEGKEKNNCAFNLLAAKVIILREKHQNSEKKHFLRKSQNSEIKFVILRKSENSEKNIKILRKMSEF